MNILNLLIKEKRIAGVEISDQIIRVAYFPPKKRFSKKVHGDKSELSEPKLVLIEKPIGPNIIREGVVINKELLGKTLKDIWTKAKLSKNYAIVSIPEDKINSRIFPFPKTVDEIHLEEAVNLAINFQLPFKKSDFYISWENAGTSNAIIEVLISAIPKNIVNDYILALGYAGIKMLALESHLASIARSTQIEKDVATLFTKRNAEGATIFILKDGTLRFSRTLPATFIKEESSLVNEIEHIKTSFESEKKISVIELPLTKAVVHDQYLKYTEFKSSDPETQSRWLIAIGAAIRGEIPRGTDNHISLLPVGTAEAYAYQRTTTFITLVRNMIISVSIFFLLTFLAAYLFIFSLSQTASKTNSSISIPEVSPDLLQKEILIGKINGLTETSAVILSTTPTWNVLLDDINSRVISGIKISNFSATTMVDQMSMVGTAKDRNTLNLFKKSLQDSIYLTAVELPITNLEQKGDIPFTVSFHLKDPSMLYYK